MWEEVVTGRCRQLSLVTVVDKVTGRYAPSFVTGASALLTPLPPPPPTKLTATKPEEVRAETAKAGKAGAAKERAAAEAEAAEERVAKEKATEAKAAQEKAAKDKAAAEAKTAQEKAAAEKAAKSKAAAEKLAEKYRVTKRDAEDNLAAWQPSKRMRSLVQESVRGVASGCLLRCRSVLRYNAEQKEFPTKWGEGHSEGCKRKDSTAPFV